MSPGYRPELIGFSVGMPCDIEDFVDSAGRHLAVLRLPFCNRLLAVRPQPLPLCATLMVVPDWVAFAALSAVCLDLRDLSFAGGGPLTAAYVSRPTCRAELCRQAGIYGTRPCRIFVGTEELPLEDDEAIQLASGCVATFMSADTYPHFATDLQYRLQFPESWPSPPWRLCVPSCRALLLLNRRGRFLFRGHATSLPLDEAAARFIGVERRSVEIRTPCDDGCAHLSHQGVGIHGVLAFVDRDTLQPELPQYVVFLDLRQLAMGIKYLVLARSYVLKTELPDLAKRRPPPGWRLRVHGGRMRRNRLDFQQNTTLVFGFEFDDDSDQPPDSFSPTTEAEDEDSEDSESDGDAGSGHSDATTRSRSVRRRHPEPSSDHSYQGGFDVEPTVGDHCADTEEPARSPSELREEPRHGAACSSLLKPLPPMGRVSQERKGGLSVKLLVEPKACGPPPVDALPHLRSMAETAGIPWRYTPAARVTEQLQLAPPQRADEVGDFPPVLSLSFAVLVPGYVQENVVVQAILPTAEDVILPLVQAARDPNKQRLFPDLLPVLPQPSVQWGLVIALPLWNPQATVIAIDARSFDTRLFAVQSPDLVSRRAVLWLAGLPPEAPVNVWSSFEPEPLRDDVEYRVFPGQCLTVAGYPLPRPDTFFLPDMLRHAASWSPRPAFPQHEPSPCYCCVTRRGHLLFVVDQRTPWSLRPDLAAACEQDASAMHLSPAQPRVLDCAVYGHTCRTVLAVGPRATCAGSRHTWAIIIDCRPILQGWHYVATAGDVDFDRLEEELGELAPPFWKLVLANRPAGEGSHPVVDGQTFVAELRFNYEDVYAVIDDTDSRPDSVPPAGSPGGHASEAPASRSADGAPQTARSAMPLVNRPTCVALGCIMMLPIARAPEASPLSTGRARPLASGFCYFSFLPASACNLPPQAGTCTLARASLALKGPPVH